MEMRYHDCRPTNKKYIQLRSKNEYILVIRKAQSENRIEVSPKLNVWWFLLDLVCGGFPVIIDGATGNWNYFETIELNKLLQPPNRVLEPGLSR